MNFEKEIDHLNETLLFKEFTYSENRFKPPERDEVELADSIVHLDDIAFVFQLKERIVSNSTPEKEEKWFRKKVLGKAVKQIKETVSLLTDKRELLLENNKGHRLDVSKIDVSSLHKIILYKPSELLPESCRQVKWHTSRTVGLVHVIYSLDYKKILFYLISPAEIRDYLSFRAEIIEKFDRDLLSLSEMALLGCFVSGEEVCIPSEKYAKHIQELNSDFESWDMTEIISRFEEKIIHASAPMDYYYIIKEIAKLPRTGLREFKKRYGLSLERARQNQVATPYIFTFLATDCTFIFIPLCKENASTRQKVLIQISRIGKYQHKSSKAIGLSFLISGKDYQDIEWCYLNSLWEYNKKIELKLQKIGSPFGVSDNKTISRYRTY